jgi:hypothetical protein
MRLLEELKRRILKNICDFVCIPRHMKEKYRHDLEPGTSNLTKKIFRKYIQYICQQLGLSHRQMSVSPQA